MESGVHARKPIVGSTGFLQPKENLAPPALNFLHHIQIWSSCLLAKKVAGYQSQRTITSSLSTVVCTRYSKLFSFWLDEQGWHETS